MQTQKRSNRLTSTGMWSVECSEVCELLESRDKVFSTLSEFVRQADSGRLMVEEDTGQRAWFSRFLFGLHPRLLQMHFAMEWCNGTASLIFFDEDVSEYRAKDKEHHVDPDDETRKMIAHGEEQPHPIDECLSLERSLKAIEEYLTTSERPLWLEYKYVE